MTGTKMHERKVLAIHGADRHGFLQGLVTNDLGADTTALVYAALLSPQGKYLADFFLANDGDRILLDVVEPLADPVAKRLNMYRLRADVLIEQTDLSVSSGLGDAPEGAFADPRHSALGWRKFGSGAAEMDRREWDALRVSHCIPESCIELLPNESYILESGFERLNGVDFRKGCYVGQEVTARMKHKTELRKGLATVSIEGSAPVGTEIRAGDRPVGTLFTQSNGQAIAYLRFDRATDAMHAGDAVVRWDG